jgi:hypothetical protein
MMFSAGTGIAVMCKFTCSIMNTRGELFFGGKRGSGRLENFGRSDASFRSASPTCAVLPTASVQGDTQTITLSLPKAILSGRVCPTSPFLSMAHAAPFSESFTITIYRLSNPPISMTSPMTLGSGPRNSPAKPPILPPKN